MPLHHNHPFPLSKLLFFIVKRVTEPVAKRIAKRARTSQNFKRTIVLPPAQAYHLYETKIKMRALNLHKLRRGIPIEYPSLKEEKAVSLGSQLVAEFLLMAIASAFAYNEHMKHKTKEFEKELLLKESFREQNCKIERIRYNLEKNSQELALLKLTLERIK